MMTLDPVGVAEATPAWRLSALVVLPSLFVFVVGIILVTHKNLMRRSLHVPIVRLKQILGIESMPRESTLLIESALQTGLPFHSVSPDIVAELHALSVPPAFAVAIDSPYLVEADQPLVSGGGELADTEETPEDAPSPHRRKRRRRTRKHHASVNINIAQNAADTSPGNAPMSSPVEHSSTEFTADEQDASVPAKDDAQLLLKERGDTSTDRVPAPTAQTHFAYDASSPFAFGLELCRVLPPAAEAVA